MKLDQMDKFDDIFKNDNEIKYFKISNSSKVRNNKDIIFKSMIFSSNKSQWIKGIVFDKVKKFNNFNKYNEDNNIEVEEFSLI